MGRFSAVERPRRWPRTKKFEGFTSGPISGWTNMYGAHGDLSEASDEACTEADPYAVTAAGNQAAANVDVGAGRPAQPGSGGEPSARRGAHGRAAGRRDH